jgi:HD superfamily phosphohydrolase
MDYLLRDSLHCGVEYGRFDHLRLIGSLGVHRNPDTQSLAIGVEPGGIHSFEAMLLARYYMSTQVYFHRVRRAYDLLLSFWLKAWGREHYEPLQNVLNFDDVALISQMKQDASVGDGSDRSQWADRLLRRQHPKLVWEKGDHADAGDLRRAEALFRRLRGDFPNVGFLLDSDAKGAIHKLFVPGDQELIDDLFIVQRDREPQRLTERSQIIAKIPKSFQSIRVLAYFGDDAQRQAVAARADEIWRTS